MGLDFETYILLHGIECFYRVEGHFITNDLLDQVGTALCSTINFLTGGGQQSILMPLQKMYVRNNGHRRK